jgi:drug/metabolite transporter (DMT)-like permease
MVMLALEPRWHLSSVRRLCSLLPFSYCLGSISCLAAYWLLCKAFLSYCLISISDLYHPFSILLVVYSLIAETPHDVLYYWRCVFLGYLCLLAAYFGYYRMSAWVDLGVMTLTFVLSIVWNLEAGIVVSMVLSLLLVVHRSAKTRMTILVSPYCCRFSHVLRG